MIKKPKTLPAPHAKEGASEKVWESKEKLLVKRIAHRTQLLRSWADLTQAEAAEKSRLGFRTWQRVEDGKMKGLTLRTLIKIAAFFGVEEVELLRD